MKDLKSILWACFFLVIIVVIVYAKGYIDGGRSKDAYYSEKRLQAEKKARENDNIIKKTSEDIKAKTNVKNNDDCKRVLNFDVNKCVR